MREKTCAFTGHRPSGFSFGSDEKHPDCVRLQEMLFSLVLRLSQSGVTRFISGMAKGTDLWAAKQVLRLREENPQIKLIAAVPCAGQAGRWNAKDRETYADILDRADEVVTLSESYTPGCMMQRNRWMVDHAEVLVAVCNGSEKGGTANTLRYAEKQKRRIYWIDPQSFTVRYLTKDEQQLQLENI